MADPGFKMTWRDTMATAAADDLSWSVIVWAGSAFGVTADPKSVPAASWAANPSNEVGVWFARLSSGGVLRLPSASTFVNRKLYFVEGDALSIDGKAIPAKSIVDLTSAAADVINTGVDEGQFLILQVDVAPVLESVASSD